MGFSGKRIVVAGGGSGIGAASSRRLAQHGVAVVISDILPVTVPVGVAGRLLKGFRLMIGCDAGLHAFEERYRGRRNSFV